MSATRGEQHDDQAAASLARAAGLGRAWAEHRAEIAEAIAGVAKLRAAFDRPADPTVEPVPSYAMLPGGARRDVGR